MKRMLFVALFLSVAAFLLPSTANAGNSHHGHHGHHSFHHGSHHFGHHGYHFGGHHSGIHLSFGLGRHYGYGYPYRSSYSYYPTYYRRSTSRYTYAAPVCSTTRYRVVYPSNPNEKAATGESNPADLPPPAVDPKIAPPPEPLPTQSYDADGNTVARPQTLFTSLAGSGSEAKGRNQDRRVDEPRSPTKSTSLLDVTWAGVSTPKTRRLLSDDAIPWVAE